MTPAQFTDRVLDAYGDTPDPRLREILAALISHLHAFATETGLTPQEWLAGLEFLTATGQKCDGERQEFILLSDLPGLSSLVDLVIPRSPRPGRPVTCWGAPADTAGGPPTSPPSCPPRAGALLPRTSSMPRIPTWTATRSSASRTR